MSESRSHKTAANRIADKYNTEYNNGEGVDIVTPGKAIEVETPKSVQDGIQQLQGHKKPAYIAGTNQDAVDKALELTQGTTIGVMNNQGNIMKSSSRKKS